MQKNKDCKTKMIKQLFKYPKLIMGIFLAVIFILLFFFTTFFKLFIMFVAIFILYRYFPPNFKKLSQFEFGVVLSGIFILLLFVGKGFGFLSVANTPRALQPVIIYSDLTPLNMVLIFIIIVLGLMYFNKRKK